MKLKVNKQFRDKITGEKYNVDDVIEVSAERGEEILADTRGLASEIKSSKSRKKK